MNDPDRLVDVEQDELKRAILRSAALDEPSVRSVRSARALAIALAASATMSGAGSAATGSLFGAGLTAKGIAGWVGIGILSGLLVSATGAVLLGKRHSSDTQVESANAGSSQVTGSRVMGAPPSASESHPAPRDGRPGAHPSGVRGPAGSSQQSSRRADAVTPSRAEPRQPVAAEAARSGGAPDTLAPQADASPPHDELAKELAEIDRARSALRGGDPAAALALLSRYEQTYKPPHFSPEASALRIDALLAHERRNEALDHARRFIASYPAHPLAPRFRALLRSPK